MKRFVAKRECRYILSFAACSSRFRSVGYADQFIGRDSTPGVAVSLGQICYAILQLAIDTIQQMVPQPHDVRFPPPPTGDVAACAGSEPAVFMQAFDDSGALWAGIGPVPAHIETNQASNQVELWLVASFVWMYDGPSPKIATIKVTGWSSDSDYLLTPSDLVTRCHGKGSAITVRVPARILV